MADITAPQESDSTPVSLEIKDAHLIFNAVWADLEAEIGRENLHFPKEIILLGGAPGSGKGTNTDFIMKARGLTCPPIVVSALLDSPAAQAIKNQGGLVGDREVIGILFRRMLEVEFRDGCVLDGFPRTTIQVECMKLLVSKIRQLNREFVNSPRAAQFRRPTVHVMVLFVDEKTSVDRQLYRGRQIEAHNEEVCQTGVGELQELRSTDLDQEAALHRYRVFKENTWDALQSLKEVFFYHLINAQGTFQEVEENILRELQYQSSLELDPTTFESIRGLPLASEMVVHARQDLVRRMDSYERDHPSRAVVNTESTIFENPLALTILIDVFSERGFQAVVDKQLNEVPERVDLSSGELIFHKKTIYRIRTYFEGSQIRRA